MASRVKAKVRLDGVLPALLFPLIERKVAGWRQECIGDLYGYRVENPGKPRLYVVKHVFPYFTAREGEDSVEGPQKNEQEQISATIEKLLDDSMVYLGDFHSHTSAWFDEANEARTPHEFRRFYQQGLVKSSVDRSSMDRGNIYMILGLGDRRFEDSHRHCPDGLSLFGTTGDYAWAIACYAFNHCTRYWNRIRVDLGNGSS